jgi:hypothetical protein
MIATHIDEYNIETTFNWKTFPFENENLSILIVYENELDKEKIYNTINKLLKVFPDKCYYDDQQLSWLKIPKDTIGYKVPFLEKITNNKFIKNEKHTLIIDLDNITLENQDEFKEFNINSISLENNENQNNNEVFPMYSDLNDKFRENFEITKITEYKTFITHMIGFGSINNIPKSYYEKFDILMFTDIDIASNYAGSRTRRSFNIGNKDCIKDKMFMTDTRIMKNNMCLYSLP